MDELLAVIQKHWGYSSLRPLQGQAMRAVLDGRDSLLVLPTGGGKSLCYQAPAVLRGETTVVVSPLISLMKDQVDALQACGVPAIQLDSSQTETERFAYQMDVLQGAVRLVFVSPERLVNTDFYRTLQKINVRTFAIDEAHCISHWGHDFRPEYRQMSRLREFFPEASVHAYTATATERVRQDIVRQLGLKDPEVLVGNFDRPNLVYRVVPRRDLAKQVREVTDRHKGEAGIIYCIRQRDVDDLAAALQKQGLNALPYHAGMPRELRSATQEAFTQEQCDLVVATVAFGMGIDRSNIRFVLHAAMPKTIEHYQQEAGRAGRDGLEAECVLLYSGSDTLLWKSIVEKSAAEAGAGSEFVASALQHLDDMDRYCRGAVCRHRALVQYFGQGFEPATCGACDLCLSETEAVADAVVVAQKILSCVARIQQRFGIGQVVAVLRGENTEKVRKFRHDQLSTFGLLKECAKPDVRDWVYQLIGQSVLVQEDLEVGGGARVPILKLNAASWEVMKGKRTVRLVQLARKEKREKPKAEAVSWEGVDAGLFEALRRLRRQLAQERQVPPYVIFTDNTLRQLASLRPATPQRMRQISGIGDAKLRDFGDQFLAAIAEYCREHGVAQDQSPQTSRGGPAPLPGQPARDQVFALFRRGLGLDEVARRLKCPRGTVVTYLGDYVREARPASLEPWVNGDVYQRIAAAARRFGTERLGPLYIALGERISSDDIRLVLTHLAVKQGEEGPPAP